jgi:cation:H+ antiporter
VIGLALLAVAGALLVAGAELFVESAAGAARRLGVTVLAVGVLLAGAEPEELVTGVVGALRGRPGLAAGDAVGANITMLTLALGLAALLRPLPVGRRVRRYALASALAGALAVAAVAGGAVGRLAAAGLLAAYAAGVALVWRVEREPPALGELAEEEAAAGSAPGGGGDDGDGDGQGRGLLGVVAGIALMTGGGVLAVQGAERVVAALGRSDDAVGLTLLALATTAELLALAWAAARRGVGEVAVAGVVGSAAYNATATLGAAALARPLHGVGGLAGPAALAAVLPLAVVALAGVGGRGAGGGGEWRLGRPAGALLVAAYTAYVAVTLH